MFFIDIQNKRELLLKHKNRFNNILAADNWTITNPYSKFLRERFDQILIGEPEELLEILKDFYQQIRNELSGHELFLALPNDTLNIHKINSRDGKIHSVNMCFGLPQPLLNFVEEVKKRLTNKQKTIAWSVYQKIPQIYLDLLPSNLKSKNDLADFKKKSELLLNQKLIVSSESFGNVFNEHLIQCIEDCKKMFDYKTFSKKSDNNTNKWDAYALCKAVAPRICPYCNRNFTPIVTIRNLDKARPELDHFIPKSIFPMFAVSFHNLIPSCHCCNHNKGSKNIIHAGKESRLSYKILHPYVREDDQTNTRLFSVSFPNESLEYMYNYSYLEKLQIKAQPIKNVKISNSFDCFSLITTGSGEVEGYYEHHDKEILASINLIRQYPSTALKEIAAILNVDETIKLDEITVVKHLKQKLIEMVMPVDCGNESLGKLKKDSLEILLKSWIC